MAYFGKNILYLRKKNNIMQVDIPGYLDITRSTWSNYENDKTEPSIDQLIEISKFFGVTLDDLLLTDLQQKDEVSAKTREGEKKEVKAEVKQEVSRIYGADDAISLVADGDLPKTSTIPTIVAEINNLKRAIRLLKAWKDQNNNEKK